MPPSRIVALLATVVAALCAPPIAAVLFCLEEPHPSDAMAGWLFCAGLLGLAWFGVDRLGRRRQWPALLMLSLLTLIGTELAARFVVVHFTVWPRQKLVRLARWAYPDLAVYQPHPFLQFVGRPDARLEGNVALGALPPFNHRGFLGPDRPVAKPGGTVRIVCLGASTTATGYPEQMERQLNGREGEVRFEAISLAHGYYNTNHAVVNFVLNGIDFEPDYVVVHHGWNEMRMCVNAGEFRGDYSHALRPFTPPWSGDALLVRASTIYRYAKHRLFGDEEHAYLDAAVFRPRQPGIRYEDAPVAANFARNLETVVDLAIARGITPVFVTQPHSTDAEVPFASAADHIERYAAHVRRLAESWSDRVVFVDLDREMTGENELFVDVGHMTADGVRRKASRIAEAILAHREANSGR